MNLEERFCALWERLGARGDPKRVIADLMRRYQEPHRRYHTSEHLKFGLAEFDEVSDSAEHPDLVEFAFFFHDSIYEIGADDNEEESTRLALTVLRKARISATVQLYVGSFIMTTKPGQIAITPDEKIMADIDLATLGQSQPVFVEYERLVREEYAFVPDEIFWPAHLEILKGFLARPYIFSTDHFRELYEKQARANLTWTIAQHQH